MQQAKVRLMGQLQQTQAEQGQYKTEREQGHQQLLTAGWKQQKLQEQIRCPAPVLPPLPCVQLPCVQLPCSCSTAPALCAPALLHAHPTLLHYTMQDPNFVHVAALPCCLTRALSVGRTRGTLMQPPW